MAESGSGGCVVNGVAGQATDTGINRRLLLTGMSLSEQIYETASYTER